MDLPDGRELEDVDLSHAQVHQCNTRAAYSGGRT